LLVNPFTTNFGDDILDLDTGLTINQATNTWTQNFTGTTALMQAAGNGQGLALPGSVHLKNGARTNHALPVGAV